MNKEIEMIENQILKIRSEIFSCNRGIDELERLSESDESQKVILSPCIDLLKNHIESKQFLLTKGEEFLEQAKKGELYNAAEEEGK